MSTLARSSSSFSGWCRQRDGLGVCVVECIGYGISKQIFTRYDTHTQTINRSSLTPADGETSFFDWKISKKEAIEFLRVGRFWYHILLFFFKRSSTIMSLSFFFFSSSSLIFFYVEEFLSSNSERVKTKKRLGHNDDIWDDVSSLLAMFLGLLSLGHLVLNALLLLLLGVVTYIK